MVSAGLAEENLLMIASFDGVYLIQLDTDEWGWEELVAYGFDFEFIPIYFRLDANGFPTGDKIGGDAWGEDTYANIANTMGPWFHQP